MKHNYSKGSSNYMRVVLNVLMLSLCVLIFSGCKSVNSKNDQTGDGSFLVYYSNASATALSSERYTPDSSEDEAEEILKKLIAKMKKPENISANKSTFLPGMVLLDMKLEKGLLSVYFSDGYNELSNSDEILFRAAFVKTVTQVPDVKYVCFYVNDQPLTDALGNTVGVMLSSDFIEDSSSDTNSFSLANLSIYYSNETGDHLVPESVTVTYGKNASVERVVIEQLIKGPSEEGHLRTVPATLAILSVSTKDGVCYVNFDSAIVTNYMSVSAEMTLYSIVNSLCELPNVNKVQISINGENKVNYRDTFDLSVPYERNLDIVESPLK